MFFVAHYSTVSTMKKYAITEKQLGETPLEATERWRSIHNVSVTTPLAYAGRLDPMATGKLLVLIGDECKVQEKYHHFDKQYEFEILFEFATDTQDVLGLPTRSESPTSLSRENVEEKINALRGTHTFPYPLFSAKTVKGKPLHTWTLEGRLDEIEIPTREMRVYTAHVISFETVTAATLRDRIFSKINSFPEVTDGRKALGRDFRRTDIRAEWNKLLLSDHTSSFLIVKAQAIVSSGTYIRTLAEHVGTMLGTQSLAFSIRRTNIGSFLPFLGTGMWVRIFR